jgi:hypothetical protein
MTYHITVRGLYATILVRKDFPEIETLSAHQITPKHLFSVDPMIVKRKCTIWWLRPRHIWQFGHGYPMSITERSSQTPMVTDSNQ